VPLLEPLLQLVIGLALQLIVSLIVGTVRFVVRVVFHASAHMVVHHPFLTAGLLLAADQQGWLAPILASVPIVGPALGLLLPYFVAVLVLVAAIRLLSDDLHRDARRQLRSQERKYRRKAVDHVKARLPWTDGQPETHGKPGVVDEAGAGVMDAFNGATPNAGGRPGEASTETVPSAPTEAPATTAPAGDVLDVHEATAPPAIPMGPAREVTS